MLVGLQSHLTSVTLISIFCNGFPLRRKEKWVIAPIRGIFFYLKNWEKTAYSDFYGLSLIALIGYWRENWSVMALPGHLERFALLIKLNMISCIHLIDLNLIKSKYIFVCTTSLLNAISILFWFNFKSISVAILFRFHSNIIFKWLDLKLHTEKKILVALACRAPWMSTQWSFLLKSTKYSPDNLCCVFFGKSKF